MLVDVTFAPMDSRTASVLSILANDREMAPIHHGTGMYEISHFNFDLYLGKRLEYKKQYPEFEGHGLHDYSEKWLNNYGVCDSIEQWKKIYGPVLEPSPRHFVVAFTPVLKSEQPEQGGWRWHKWGPYIGNQREMGGDYEVHEYLYDEPKCDVIYVFHIYEL